MTLEQALSSSDYSSASHIDQNGYGFYIDGSIGDGYDLSSGVDGMPANWQGHYDTAEQVKEAIPPDVVSSDRWEAVGEADA